MPRVPLLTSLGVLLAVVGCERGPAGEAGRSPAPGAPSATPPTPATAAPSAPAEVPADAGPELLSNVDRSCSTDQDCVATYEMYEEEGHCCHSCDTDAVSARWLERAVPACAAMGGEGCPMKKCVQLSKVSCQNGSCAVAAK